MVKKNHRGYPEESLWLILEPRAASNATGLAAFELVGDDQMSYTINASGVSRY